MFNIVLYQPEIPHNTGNIIRLCANTNSQLHLIKPLGFQLDNKNLRRAGLDYHDTTKIKQYINMEEFIKQTKPKNIFAFSTKGNKNYSAANFIVNDFLLFGPETRGLPKTILNSLSEDTILKLPMAPNNRSLNLSNTVAIAVYEAWRQNEFQITA